MISYALRAISSTLMLAAVAAVAAMTVLAAATALVVAVMAGGVWAVGAGIVVIAMLAVVGVRMSAARRRGPEPVVGVFVTSDEQPLLWVEVLRVAEGLDIRPPDELSLAPNANVAASEHRTWMGLRPGVRHLQLGLPLLAGLTERQLRAAVAQECCRCWGPLSLGRVVDSGRGTAGRIADLLGEGSRAGRIFARYGRLYVAVSGPVSRRQELEADRLSADVAGKEATEASLSEAAVIRRGWADFVEGYAEPAVAVRRRPKDLFRGFEGFLDEPGRRSQLAESAAETASPSPYDSQLSLGERLAAIASLPEDDMHDRSRRAIDMLRDPDSLIRGVEDSMFRESGFVPSTWEDIVPEVGRAAACEDALQLARLGQEGGLGPTLSVATLLELMSLGFVDEMVRPMLVEGASVEAERLVAGRLVTGFLATAAIECGTAGYRFSWASPRLLVDDQGAVDDLPQLVDSALADQTTVPALEQWLTSHRVGQELELGADLGSVVGDGQSVPLDDALPSPVDALSSPDDALHSPDDAPAERPADSHVESAKEDPSRLLVPVSETASR